MSMNEDGIRELGSAVDPASYELPALHLNDEDMRSAEESLQRSNARLDVKLFIMLTASLRAREVQLMNTLRSLAVTRADADDSAILLDRYEALTAISQSDLIMDGERERIADSHHSV